MIFDLEPSHPWNFEHATALNDSQWLLLTLRCYRSSAIDHYYTFNYS